MCPQLQYYYVCVHNCGSKVRLARPNRRAITIYVSSIAVTAIRVSLSTIIVICGYVQWLELVTTARPNVVLGDTHFIFPKKKIICGCAAVRGISDHRNGQGEGADRP
jgi:hypothetical protein